MVGLKSPTFLQNWLSADDVWNLLHLADWEVIKTETRILWPVRTPVWSWFCNRWLAPLLPPLCVMVGMMARPKPRRDPASQYRCSAVIPTRNEAGNIEEAVRWPGWGSSCKILENSELGKVTKRSTTGPWTAFVQYLPLNCSPLSCGRDAAAVDSRARECACLARQKDAQGLAQPRAEGRLVGCAKLARVGRREPGAASAAMRV